jgi:outer membrane protein OmpA-like peptidoglycan-associated protein
MRIRCLLAAAAGVTWLSVLPAYPQTQDVPGSSDHPRISRFEGSIIVKYNAGDFGRLVIPLSPMTSSKGATKTETVEGRSRSIVYNLPAGHNAHEVFRTYETALQKNGFKTLYTCAGRVECGVGWFGYVQATYNVVMGGADRESQRYLAAKRTDPTGDSYVTLYTFDESNRKGGRALLNIVDVAPLREGLVTISAAEMAKDLGATGHVAIYGVYFDFDKADLKPESASALQEMAKLLQQNPGLNVAIVGHTDNVGTFDHNLVLSERRAAAVLTTLATHHKIDPKRLVAKGVGPFAPVATNKTDDGRAKNRRVELVER